MEDKLKQEIVLGEIFGIELNATFKIFRVSLFFYLLWILISASRFVPKLVSTNTNNNIPHFIENYRVIPIVYLVQIIISLVGVYYSYKSFKTQNNGLALSDSNLFTKHYLYYRYTLRASIITTSINILLYIIVAIKENFVN
jgi:hypothetical protein